MASAALSSSSSFYGLGRNTEIAVALKAFLVVMEASSLISALVVAVAAERAAMPTRDHQLVQDSVVVMEAILSSMTIRVMMDIP